MSTVTEDYEQQLELGEKKHKKLVEFDLVAVAIVVIVVAFLSITNLSLKSSYKPVREGKTNTTQALSECNKSLLNIAETFRKNTGDDQARAGIDAQKAAFDAAIGYYGAVVRKGTAEGVFLTAIDSSYRAAVATHRFLESQKDLKGDGVGPEMLANLDQTLKRLKDNRDALVAGIKAYNASGFFLAFSWMTPYPKKIEHAATPLPEFTPFAELAAVVQP